MQVTAKNDAPASVVGIGASAGGVEAFRSFFEAMPADSGLAFIVVLHSSAGHKSLLPEIIGRWTPMRVSEAGNGDRPKANEVLIIPPATFATLQDGRLRLHEPKEGGARVATPIDVLFDSLANALGEDVVGVILSGSGHDGALGLKAIKTCGGLTLAQGTNGTAPQYDGMPNSAVALDAVDLHVPVETMPGYILAARRTREVLKVAPESDDEHQQRIRLAICAVLRSRLGHDFSQYKEQTFMRRVQRQMQVLRITDLDDYVARLEADREQVVLLFRDLLISVTSFFRDTDAFETLARDVVPRLFAGKDAEGTVRIWVPGCATGEEAYSLAILLREYMDTLAGPPKVQIFASDIDEFAISAARSGRYPGTLLEGLSAERRARFFVRGENGYSVAREIRELCTFSAHSLIRDPPFSRIDMVSCRNLLIYLNSDLQSTVIPLFHYSLLPGGILLLGSSETIPQHAKLFEPLNRSHRIFLRREGPSEAPRMAYVAAREVLAPAKARPDSEGDGKAHWKRAVGLAGQRVLERFASAYVVVTATGEIAHYSNNTGKFLEPAVGMPTTNLFDMARRGWNLDLRNALQRCVESGRSVEHERSFSGTDGQPGETVRLVVEPLTVPGTTPLYLVIFAEAGAVRSAHPVQAVAGPGDAGLVAQLEAEVRGLRDQLQSVTEEYGTALEELRSANEEMQSVNEELQSTNEELETSKEEIQSINEEINTVNAQLSSKVDELDKAGTDLKNLFESTKVATIFLDPFLVIRNFTPEIATIYNLIPSDVGRPLTDIVSRLRYNSLRDDTQQVLQTLEPLERRVAREDRTAHYLMRILPYRGPDSGVDGSLVTFVDVTSIVRAEEHQRLLVDELNHRVKNMLTVVISLATHTLRRSAKLEDFSDIFLGRLHALTDAYALVTRDGWSNVKLRDVLTQELRAFLSPDRQNIHLDGPDISIEPRGALALGMAVHELTTNATKYGALSVPDGIVRISWATENQDGHDYLLLRWVEENGPAVTPPARRGFGMTLIERTLAHDLGGEMKLAFEPGGVTASLRAPLRRSAHSSLPGAARDTP